MDTASIEKKFRAIGADAKVGAPRWRGGWGYRALSVDVSKGVFDITADENVEVQVVDFDPKSKHLLLHANENGQKHKFLCGHDERDWFVAAVPGNGINGIDAAMDALKPQGAVEAQQRKGVRRKNRHRRHNAGYIRQGEWFFIPQEDIKEEKNDIIFKDEPLTRNAAAKPHICEMMMRRGGQSVWVHARYAPTGISHKAYEKMRKRSVEGGFEIGWLQMVRDARVYVKGKISHADHATIDLNGWHLVEMNTESNAPSVQNVAFLD